MKKVTIGIDIGGTNTVFGFVDKDGNILAENAIKTQEYKEVEPFLDALTAKINETHETIKNEVDIQAIGIGAPNGNYHKGTIEYAPNLVWGNLEVKLAELMQKHCHYPVFVTNDANAAAIGEMVFGAAKGMKDFLFITLGTGVGSGIVANGEMIYGHDAFAGEVGHVIVEKNGRECGCGRKGCLETYASATGLRRTVYELMGSTNTPSKLRDVSFNTLTAKDVSDAANEGDQLALATYDFTAEKLGFALANSLAYTSPKAIFLFGGLANAGKLIFEPTKKYMNGYALKIYQNKVDIIPSGLSANAAIVGASALAWNEIETAN